MAQPQPHQILPPQKTQRGINHSSSSCSPSPPPPVGLSKVSSTTPPSLHPSNPPRYPAALRCHSSLLASNGLPSVLQPSNVIPLQATFIGTPYPEIRKLVSSPGGSGQRLRVRGERPWGRSRLTGAKAFLYPRRISSVLRSCQTARRSMLIQGLYRYSSHRSLNPQASWLQDSQSHTHPTTSDVTQGHEKFRSQSRRRRPSHPTPFPLSLQLRTRYRGP